MRFTSSLAALAAQALCASATWTAYKEYLEDLPQDVSKRSEHHRSHRPEHHFHPYPPCRQWGSHPRHKECVVKTHDDMETDDSEYILDALHECNHGGTVVFPAGKTYVIGTALDMKFLENIDIDMQAYIQFTNDTEYWEANSFKQIYQNATTFFELGGTDVNLYGGGMLDGNGQVWYDLYAEDIYILRPILFGTLSMHSGSISGLRLRYSPQWFNFVANSTDVVFQDMDIRGGSESNNTAKNTDGWDTYRSDNIVIQDSVVDNGDDCVSFKPNSTEILIQNLQCNGSHGISVGSLGQYPGEVDIVENIMVSNISMSNASDGARIKVWPGASAALSGDLQGGGGSGRVQNITYEGMYISNVDYAIEITQCYGQRNLTACNEFPSSLEISDIFMRDFKGETSENYDPISGTVVCSSPDVCGNINVEDIRVVSPSGVVNQFECDNVDEGLLEGIECTPLEDDE